MKHFISTILLLLAILLPATANAYDFEVDGIYYNITSPNTVEVTYKEITNNNNNSYGVKVTIPNNVTFNSLNFNVTAIGDSAFCYCDIREVTIPESVTSIGVAAFKNIEKTLIVTCLAITPPLMDDAFDHHVHEFPSSIFLSTNAMNACALDDLVLYVPSIAYVSYKNKNDSEGYFSWIFCYDWEKTPNPSYSITWLQSYTHTYGVTLDFSSDEECTFYARTAAGGAAGGNIIWFKDFQETNSITATAMFDCMTTQFYIEFLALEEGKLPSDVITFEGHLQSEYDIVDDYSFESEGLCYDIYNGSNEAIVTHNTKMWRDRCSGFKEAVASEEPYSGHIVIPSVVNGYKVTTIGYYAFEDVPDLTEVEIPATVTDIYSTFNAPKLSKMTIMNPIPPVDIFFDSQIYENATLYVPFKSLDAYKNAQGWQNFKNICGISEYDFEVNGCYYKKKNGNEVQLTYGPFPYHNTVIVPSNVTYQGINYSVTGINNDAFYGSGLNYLTIPVSINSIDDSTFTDINLESIYITGNGEWQARALPETVKTLYIGSGVTGVKGMQLDPEKIYSYATTPPVCDENSFTGYDAELHVPASFVAAYFTAPYWSNFTNIIGDAVAVTNLTLDQDSVKAVVGNQVTLVATVLPENATDKTVDWTTSNGSVATVNSEGLVTAVNSGTAIITAMATNGSNLSASCVITVKNTLSDYENYLSISDTEVFRGDTIVIPVSMTNTQSIVSFQTDIYLPDGLEVIQEDGEYVIDSSDRMTRTHSIMSNRISNGAIRVLCYSSNYKPFTGNSGDDLFYITVKVADDAEGDYTIKLNHTLFTNSDLEELTIPNVAANVHVNAYLQGDANGSGSVTVTDVVVTSQYVLELNPQPFIFEAADVNADNNITVTDVSRIAWMVLNPSLTMPLRAPAYYNSSDNMSGNDITLTPGETRTVNILLDNEMDYSAFQLDLSLPEGLTASNYQLTDRASGHAFDVNALSNGKTRVLCYSPALEAIDGHEGALLTFDVSATGAVNGNIYVDGIELVTADCQTVKPDSFAIGVNSVTSVNELNNGKIVARVDYFNVIGQQIVTPESGLTFVVTTYTDGTCAIHKIIR